MKKSAGEDRNKDSKKENHATKFENKLIQVCTECGLASCWHGIFLCPDSRHADIELKTVAELRKMAIESEDYWSDEHLTDVFGEPAPDGYAA